jgi:tetratricopeptide (TPR) repeat protein/transcriptional regulator with XRE-family HTH domain
MKGHQQTISGGALRPPAPTKVCMNDDIRAFGAQLRARRRAVALSQQDLADRAGLSVRAISNLERGRTGRPYRDSLARLADALGLRCAAREEFLAAGRRLRQEAAGDLEGRAGYRAGPATAGEPQRFRAPRQLPAPVPGFVGRAEALAALSGLLPPSGDGAPVVVSGTAGVGKTALAVHWAHRAAADFPDGQLYVNLRGYDAGPPRTPADALAGLLRALGVDAARIPGDRDERAAALRGVLAGRRVLLLLDNARDAGQVRPLLPGTPGCAVLVTSRDALAGLVARDGARRVGLDLLPEPEAIALLGALIGPRAEAEPEAVGTLAAQCSRLPLALRVAAELAAAREGSALTELTGELSDLRRRLDVLDAGGDEGTAVRAVLSWSYRQLEPSAARALRAVALHPGADFDVAAAAALIGAEAPTARRTLDRLARASLVRPVASDRYELHDLLRGFARELAETEDEAQAREGALSALLDHYVQSAAEAMDLLFPAEAARRPDTPRQRADAPRFQNPDEARGWLDGERANLTAAVAFAAAPEAGPHDPAPGTRDPGFGTRDLGERAIRLAATVERYLNFGHHLADATAVHVNALRTARRSGDARAEATALSHLGFVEWERGRYRQAIDYQNQALTLLRALDDPIGQARALHRLSLVQRGLGDLDEAWANAMEVLRLCRAHGERLGQARALHLLGTLSLARGRYAEAGEHLRASLALQNPLADQRSHSVTVKELGVIELRYGRLAAAAGHFRQARQLCLDAGNRSGEAEAVSQLGSVLLRQGRTQEALSAQEWALTVFREIEDAGGQASALARHALADVAAGRATAALGLLEQALTLTRRLGLRPAETTVLNGLGEALVAAGRAHGAPSRHRAALELAGQTGDAHEAARAHQGLAAAHAALGQQDRALAHARIALDRYRALGVPEADEVLAAHPDADAVPAAHPEADAVPAARPGAADVSRTTGPG